MIRLERPSAAPGVALLVIDRPDKRNALTPDMLRSIVEAVGSLGGTHGGSLGGPALRAGGATDVRAPAGSESRPTTEAGALVLAGEGAVFCSGFDMSLCRHDSGAMAQLLTALSGAIRAMRALPIPVVCAAHGGAVAGGCALLTGCDIVVTDDGAKLGYPVVRLGISPAINTPTLRMALTDGATRERALSPELISGADAVRLGLAHERVAAPEQVRPRALEIASALAAKPRHALAVTKRWLNEIDGSNDSDILDRALGASLALAGGAEERERLAALWK